MKFYGDDMKINHDMEIILEPECPITEELLISLTNPEDVSELIYFTEKGNRIEFKRKKTSEWLYIEDNSYFGGGCWRCKECGYSFALGAFFAVEEEFGYCPHCGADIPSVLKEKE